MSAAGNETFSKTVRLFLFSENLRQKMFGWQKHVQKKKSKRLVAIFTKAKTVESRMKRSFGND